MDPELSQKIAALQEKVDAMYTSVEKLRRYFLWTGMISIAVIVLPLIGLVFVIPSFLSSYSNLGSINADTLNSLTQ